MKSSPNVAGGSTVLPDKRVEEELNRVEGAVSSRSGGQRLPFLLRGEQGVGRALVLFREREDLCDGGEGAWVGYGRLRVHRGPSGVTADVALPAPT